MFLKMQLSSVLDYNTIVIDILDVLIFIWFKDFLSICLIIIIEFVVYGKFLVMYKGGEELARNKMRA
jgi:hypothetical protein